MLSNTIDGSDDFAVDFRKDFSGENVSQFGFSIQTVDCLEVLGEFQGVFCFQSTALSSNGDLLNRECHFVEGIGSAASKIFSVVCTHTLTYGVGVSNDTRGWVQSGRVRTRLTSCTHTNVTSGESVGEVERVVLTSECGICFVEQGFGSVLSLVAGTHREDQSSRTGHWLYASEVISDQVRHRASDQGDQNRVKTSNGLTTLGGETSVTNSVGWSFGEEVSFLTKSDFLVFQELSSYCSTMIVLDTIKTFVVQKGCPLLLQYLVRRHLHLNCTSF